MVDEATWWNRDSWEGYKEDNRWMFNPKEDHKVELAKAVFENNAIRLRALLDQHGGIDFVDKNNNTLLRYALRLMSLTPTRSLNVIDVLLATEGVPLNAVDQYEHTPLLQTVLFCGQNVSRRLIERGADINCRGYKGRSTLHCAVEHEHLELCLLLIERGINVNCCDDAGDTPLAFACRADWKEGVQMLLDKGADVNICNKKGKHMFLSVSLDIRELLVDYVQHDCKTQLPLCILTSAIFDKSRLLGVWLEYVTEILYGPDICPRSFISLFGMLPQYFKVFLAKFESDLKYFIKDNRGFGLCIFGEIASKAADVETIENTIENFVTLINSRLSSDFFYYCINGVRPEDKFNSFAYPKDFTMSNMFLNFEKLDTDGKRKLVKLISILVSKGVSYNDNDVGTVYLKLGYCPLFKQMIAMEFDVLESKTKKKVLMLELIYDVQMSLEKFFDESNYLVYCSDSPHLVLDHFCDQRLKEFCSKLKDERTDRKLMKLPQVPSLLELSRNVARKHIVNSYQIQSFPEFVRILNKQSILKVYKEILTYERKLYDFL